MKILISLLASVILFSGCELRENYSPESSQEQIAEQDQPQQAVFDSEIRPLHDVSTQGFIRPYVTQEGFYSTQLFGQQMYLLYNDFTTMQQVFLCSAPNCEHDDESCTAYSEGGFISGFVVDRTGENIMMMSSVSGQESRFEIRDLSGANQQIKFAMETNGYEKFIGEGENYLYIVGFHDGVQGLWAIDLENESWELIFEHTFLLIGNWYSHFADGQYIYIVYDNDDEFSADNTVSGDREFVIDRFDAVTGEIENIYKEQVNAEVSTEVMFIEGEFYIPQQDDEIIVERFDPYSGERVVLGGFGDIPSIVSPQNVIDGMLSVVLVDNEQERRFYRHMELSSGETTDVMLSFESRAKGGSFDVEVRVLADLGDDLLVSSSETLVNHNAPDGQGLFPQPINTYSLISKEDYFSGNPNYRVFDNSAIVKHLEGIS